MLDTSKKITKKIFSFELPEFLEDAIDAFIQAHNSNDSLTDCYQDELYSDINCCLHGDLTDEQLEEVRGYYIRGGMYDENQ